MGAVRSVGLVGFPTDVSVSLPGSSPPPLPGALLPPASPLLVPLLGWLKTNAAGHVLVLFDTVELPVLMEKNRELAVELIIEYVPARWILALPERRGLLCIDACC